MALGHRCLIMSPSNVRKDKTLILTESSESDMNRIIKEQKACKETKDWSSLFVMLNL